MSMLKDRRERSRFVRYSIVGAVGAAVDFTVLNILTSLFGVTSVIASVLSFIAAVISNFTWNRYWTYPDSRSKKFSRQLIQFSVVSIIGLGIRTSVFAILESMFLTILINSSFTLPFEPDIIALNLALAVVIGIVMVWNFVVNRFWTFSDVD